MREPYLKNYCIIGLGKVTEVKEDLKAISEDSINFVSGDGLIIATFASAFHIGEIEVILKTNDRSYILFEMTPGFFSANIENFVLINIPIHTGTVVINNRATLVFKNFKSCKTVISLIIIGEITINMKGIVMKDKIAEIAVKETDKAIFPFANLVI